MPPSGCAGKPPAYWKTLPDWYGNAAAGSILLVLLAMEATSPLQAAQRLLDDPLLRLVKLAAARFGHRQGPSRGRRSSRASPC
jgi:hypothetical protein